jgi:predicted nucleic acid-binding protein
MAAPLAAPALLPFECANVLRRLAASGRLGGDLATQAATDVQLLRVELWPYAALAVRSWELRGALTIYDASYVALASELDAPLATLDSALVRAGADACRFLTPS